jgi:predicted DNA-binding protein
MASSNRHIQCVLPVALAGKLKALTIKTGSTQQVLLVEAIQKFIYFKQREIKKDGKSKKT